MSAPEKRPTPAEILEMVRQFGRTREELGISYEGEPRNTITGLQRSCDEQLAKIAAALATYGWRPIAGAPKDGTPFHGLHLWNEKTWLVSTVAWDKWRKCFYLYDTGPCQDEEVSPTHFQHIPAPPTKEG